MTATQRRLTDGLRFLPSSAVTGGADFDWRFKSRYSLAGYLGRERRPRRRRRRSIGIQQNSRHYFQRPDATSFQLDPSATSLAGSAAKIGISKIGGERIRFASNLGFKSPGFDINDLGFFRRADDKNMNNWLQIRSEKPSRWFRSRYLNFNQYAHWNYDGDLLGSGGNVNAHANFTNNWSTGGGFNFNQTYFDDRLSRGGPGGLFEDYNGVWFYVNSDDRHAVSFNYNGSFFDDGHGSFVREYMPTRDRSSGAGGVGRRRHADRDDGDRHAMGEQRHRHEAALCLRPAGTDDGLVHRPRELHDAADAVAAAVRGAVRVGRRLRRRSRSSWTDETRSTPRAMRRSPTPDNPDFNYRSFRTTNVLRWEYRPGSTLFVVWQQAREGNVDDGAFRFRRDFHDTFNTPGKNVFLVKLAYWLNY